MAREVDPRTDTVTGVPEGGEFRECGFDRGWAIGVRSGICCARGGQDHDEQ